MVNKVYPEMNTLVRVCENTLLSDTHKNELVSSHDTSAVKKTLLSFGFFKYASPEPDDDFIVALDKERKGWLDWCSAITPDKNISDVFTLDDKLHNLRVYLKERLLKKDMTFLYDTDSKYNSEYFSGICSDARTSDRYAKLIFACESDYSIHSSFARVELAVRFFCHRELLELAEGTKNEGIIRFVKAKIDLDLISVILQGRKTGLALNRSLLEQSTGCKLALDMEKLLACKDEELDMYFADSAYASFWASLNKKDTPELFDVLTDNYLLSLCASAKLEAFGIFPLFAFMYAKLLDIKNVRVIILLKKAEASDSELSERMRDSYEL